MVEWEEFHGLCLTLNFTVDKRLIRSYSAVLRRIASEYEYQKALVKDYLQRAQFCCYFCTDTWTSCTRNQQVS